ncbi:MAG: hypothetical protein IJS61_08225 [Firmicutes bacterium]|nr:hypothetical protein [Bacillota bacterium]
MEDTNNFAPNLVPCPHCGKGNPDGARYCFYCKGDLRVVKQPENEDNGFSNDDDFDSIEEAFALQKGAFASNPVGGGMQQGYPQAGMPQGNYNSGGYPQTQNFNAAPQQQADFSGAFKLVGLIGVAMLALTAIIFFVFGNFDGGEKEARANVGEVYSAAQKYFTENPTAQYVMSGGLDSYFSKNVDGDYAAMKQMDYTMAIWAGNNSAALYMPGLKNLMDEAHVSEEQLKSLVDESFKKNGKVKIKKVKIDGDYCLFFR